MKVNTAEFVKSAYNYEQFPRHSLPEIAFSGKSNVGKSSMINTLVNRKKLAKISSTPGKTQSINFYNLDNKFYLVDLPGYGFAKVPDKVKEHWAELIEDYLYNRENLRGIVQIVDVRHKPTEDDKLMVDWINAVNIPALIVATKVDKISRGKRKQKKQLIKNQLDYNNEIVFFSAKNGEGRKKISSFIMNLV